MSACKANPKLPLRKALLRSDLLQASQYDALVEELGTDEEATIIKTLVANGFFTEYQIQQLQAGRSKLHLGPYLITDYIGQGGMGRVFKGVHEVILMTIHLTLSTTSLADSWDFTLRV